MTTKCFTGSNVFLSRNLIAPEIFDSIHDALNHNGAQVFLCSDPSRTGPDDYHVISSSDHVKFDDLKAKGCKLLGPQCVLSCAKENRSLPKRDGFTCCLAMDGVKVLASGFEKEEKVKIEELVTSMGGVLQNRASLNVNFVIVKNVLAAKYKWALTSLKKPIVTTSWLQQCWNEHRVVPQEPYRVLPFSGLTICVSRLPPDVRKDMEKLIRQNGGIYSADLTKKCTHLVTDEAEGDKYKVARKWGHIHIVTKNWFDLSIGKRACLSEESYPVLGPPVSLTTKMKVDLKAQQSQDKGNTVSQGVPCSLISDLETTISHNMPSQFSDSTTDKDEGGEAPALRPGDEKKFDGFVAEDSQTEDNDLYLADCRILLVGFQAAEMRKLVHVVRKGGGSRYMSFNDKLTHIIIGTPTDNEKKEIRRLAALGVIHVVGTIWLEDCDKERREVPVSQRHIVSDLFFSMDSACFTKAAVTGIYNTNQSRSYMAASHPSTIQEITNMSFEIGKSLEKNSERKLATNPEGGNSLEELANHDDGGVLRSSNACKVQKMVQLNCDTADTQHRKISDIFKGMVFCFSSSFPEDRRAEIVEWVNEGGGEVVDDHREKKVQYTIECHGQKWHRANGAQSTVVSSHWIRSCLEDGSIPDVGSHIIYTPLTCRIPLPGFDRFRICVSQYEEKERLLLRNLCFVLGAKFTEKLSKKVTHLICKFSSGPKFMAACKWRIQSVTSDWISECIRQDAIVPIEPFRPKDVTAHDQEAGLCTMSQYPTQAARMVLGDGSSQLPSQSQVIKKLPMILSDDSSCPKRARIMEDDIHKQVIPTEVRKDVSACNVESIVKNTSVVVEVSRTVPDVAAAIEDLLEQSTKIQDMVTAGNAGSDRNIFSPDDGSILDHDRIESRSALIPNQWLSRTEKQDDVHDPPGQNVKKGTYDGFSETQTESQVVGYEEDLSGIQMIIDKARARSSLV